MYVLSKGNGNANSSPKNWAGYLGNLSANIPLLANKPKRSTLFASLDWLILEVVEEDIFNII